MKKLKPGDYVRANLEGQRLFLRGEDRLGIVISEMTEDNLRRANDLRYSIDMILALQNREKRIYYIWWCGDHDAYVRDQDHRQKWCTDYLDTEREDNE